MRSANPDANTPTAAAPRHRGFRAVIVGGGPVGLGLAHMLDRAGVDYVVLERRPTVLEESGFGLAFYPHGVRLLDQLGMLDEARRLYLPMRDKTTFAPDGRERCYNRLYECIEECNIACGGNGGVFVTVSLADTACLWTPSLVTATPGCSDGSVVEGSFVAACDGVHSPVRTMMDELDDLKSNKSSKKSKNKKKPVMTAPYQLLIGHLDPIPDMPRNRLHEVHGKAGFSMQIFMFDTEGWFLAYRRLDPAPADTYVRYTDADADAFARDIMDRPVGEGRTFADLWKARRWVRLVTTEEGVVPGNWHRGRVVLVGDSACKMTPNAGLSANQGWQGAAALTNGLRRLLLSSKGNQEEWEPDTAALEAVFRGYREATLGMAKGSARASGLYIRATSWHTPLYRVVDWLVPKLGGDEKSFKIFSSPVVKQGLLLDWLPEPGYKAGTVEWLNKAKVQQKTA